MAGTNNFLPFCPTDTGTNLLSQADYAVDGDRTIGNEPGIARLELVNKALRQANVIASQLAQYVANKTNLNMLDDGNLSNILSNIGEALNGPYNDGGTLGGSANAITLTPTVPLLAYAIGVTYVFVAGLSSTSSPVTVNVSGLGAKQIHTLDDLNLPNGVIVAGNRYTIVYDGVHFRVSELMGPSNLLGNSVTSGALAPGAVISGKLGSGAVQAGNIDTGAVTSGTIAAGAVVAGDLAAASVDSASLQSNLNLPGKSVQENGNNVVVSSFNAGTSLAIIRGVVADDGTILYGEGFTITPVVLGGVYTITFTTAFTDVPAVVPVALAPSSGQIFSVVSISSTQAVIQTGTSQSGFSFIIIGART